MGSRHVETHMGQSAQDPELQHVVGCKAPIHWQVGKVSYESQICITPVFYSLL